MTDDVLISTDRGVGRLRLNRPKAIHALTREMCEAMSEALLRWREDNDVHAVIIDHAQGRGFCAGGDVVMLARSGAADAGDAKRFFFAEYRLNHLLFSYPKPTLAIMDGITMGGGVGISLPCTYRVATENTRFAMPETGIGLFPDVGGGWVLPRLPGEVGMYLALTGARLDAAGAVALGIATHYVPTTRLEGFEAALATTVAESEDGRAAINDVLDRFSETPGEDPLAAHRPVIDRCFAEASVEAVLDALDREAAGGSAFAGETAATLRQKCPTSLKITFEQLRRGRAMSSLADVLTMEYRMAQHCMEGTEFFEGIRAILVDRDHAPKWRPATLEMVTSDLVDRHFGPVEGREFSL